MFVRASLADLWSASPTTVDLTPFVKSVSTRRGRQHELQQIEASTIDLAVEDRFGFFDSWNTQSPLVNQLLLTDSLLDGSNSYGWTDTYVSGGAHYVYPTGGGFDGNFALGLTNRSSPAANISSTSSLVPCRGGQTYNGFCTFLANPVSQGIGNARNVSVGIAWYTSAQVIISTSTGTQVSDGANVQPTVQAVAPSNAAYMALVVTVYGVGPLTAAGQAEMHLASRFGITQHYADPSGLYLDNYQWGPGGVGLLGRPVQVLAGPLDVTVYGRPGTFGTAAGDTYTATGQSFAALPAAGMGMPPGLTVFFSVTTPDSLVAMAMENISGNELSFTSTTGTFLGLWNPANLSFDTVPIPTSTGQFQPPNCNGATGAPLGTFGSPVDQVTVCQAGGVETLYAVCPTASYGAWQQSVYGEAITLAAFQQVSGQWTYNPSLSYTATQLSQSSSEGAAAFPVTSGNNYWGESYAKSYGTVGIGTTPISNHLIIIRYFYLAGQTSGSLVAVNPNTGGVVGFYQLPAITALDGTPLSVSMRNLCISPVGASGDERFIVTTDCFVPDWNPVLSYPSGQRVYDPSGPGQYACIQVPNTGNQPSTSAAYWSYLSNNSGAGNASLEFSYDSSTGVFTLESSPVDPVQVPMGQVATAPYHRNYGSVPGYDASGNLWYPVSGASNPLGSLESHSVAVFLASGTSLPTFEHGGPPVGWQNGWPNNLALSGTQVSQTPYTQIDGDLNFGLSGAGLAFSVNWAPTGVMYVTGLTGIIAAFTPQSPFSVGANIITNSGFTTNTAGWNGFGVSSVTRVADAAFASGYCAQITRVASGTGNNTLAWQTTSVAAGQCYKFVAQFQTPVTGRDVYIFVTWTDASGASIETDNSDTWLDNSSVLTTVTFYVTAPVGAVTATPVAIVYNVPSGESHYVTMFWYAEPATLEIIETNYKDLPMSGFSGVKTASIVDGALVCPIGNFSSSTPGTVLPSYVLSVPLAPSSQNLAYAMFDSVVGKVTDEVTKDSRLPAADALKLFANSAIDFTMLPGYLLATSPSLLWRFNDPIGSLIFADATGNGYAGLPGGRLLANAPTGFGLWATPVEPTDVCGYSTILGSAPIWTDLNLPGPLLNATTGAFSFFFSTTGNEGSRILALVNPFPTYTSVGNLQLVLSASGGLLLEMFNGTSWVTVCSGTANVTDGHVHQVVGTWNGTTMTLYVDGSAVQSAAQPYPFNTLAVPCLGSSVPWQMPFKAQDFALWNGSAPTATQISEMWFLAATVPTGDAGGYDSFDSGTMMYYMLLGAGVPDAKLSIAIGISMLQAPLLVPGTSYLGDFIAQVQSSELGSLFQDTDGMVVFWNRHYAIANSRATTVQATLSNLAGSTFYLADGFEPTRDDLDLWNDIPTQINPSNSADFVPFPNTPFHTAFDPLSARVYGKRSLQGYTGLLYLSDNDAIALGQFLLSCYKSPIDRVRSVSIDSVANAGANLSIMGTLSFLDLLQIVYRSSGQTTDFSEQAQIEEIQHHITPGPYWTTTFQVSPYIFGSTNWFTLDSSVLGRLSSPGSPIANRLGF